MRDRWSIEFAWYGYIAQPNTLGTTNYTVSPKKDPGIIDLEGLTDFDDFWHKYSDTTGHQMALQVPTSVLSTA